jgi:Arc/MetJ-type ribon-helix-helix transcriptional regulator
MNLDLPPKVQKLIRNRVKSGKYARPEDVVAAAISSLDQQESYGDFDPCELNKLIAQGEREIAAGEVIDGDLAFAELRRLSAKRRKKAG